MSSSSAFLYEPRAAFYTEKVGKKQNKIAHLASAVRKNFQRLFNAVRDESKKTGNRAKK
ncbi:TPA: hypothetical protein QCG56_004051 [Enterobacter cancerogenus]|nr:hypothetical protein [Enterobacter cancerogenus]HDR2167145.1 hypothetical protein [Enterobacter cancerogenus]HDR2269727.1 hypothetical protein [Enterobacter cancerogenus]